VNIAGSAAFDFTCLLHTYFRVPDVTGAAVSNLRGCTFTDKVDFYEFWCTVLAEAHCAKLWLFDAVLCYLVDWCLVLTYWCSG